MLKFVINFLHLKDKFMQKAQNSEKKSQEKLLENLPQNPKILIIGGGYGGLRVALSLQKLLDFDGENAKKFTDTQGEKNSPNLQDYTNLQDTQNHQNSTLSKEFLVEQNAKIPQITLISKHDYHYQTTLLHKVAIGTLSSRKARIFYRKILDPQKLRFVKDKIIRLDPQNKCVWGNGGRYDYDVLVISLGFKPENFGIKGVSEYAYKLSSLNAALKLAKNIENKFKDFAHTKDENDLKFIVCGTGFTGIEFAAELASQIKELCLICGIDESLPKIYCVGRSEQILPVFSERLSKIAREKLEKMGVCVITNANVKEVQKDGVIIESVGERGFVGNFKNDENGLKNGVKISKNADESGFASALKSGENAQKSGENALQFNKNTQNFGENSLNFDKSTANFDKNASQNATQNAPKTLKIHANTILWSAGVKGSDIIEKAPLTSKRGRIEVNAQLRSVEHKDIFVVGDSAHPTTKDALHAPTAQLSSQMGDFVAKAIAQRLAGKDFDKSFKFKHRGTVCSIGHTDAVGIVYGREVVGELAAFVKNTIENRWLFGLGGFKMVFKKGQFRFRTSN